MKRTVPYVPHIAPDGTNWNALMVGDPDPGDEGDLLTTGHCAVWLPGFPPERWCTRAYGHRGQHVAAGQGVVHAVWFGGYR